MTDRSRESCGGVDFVLEAEKESEACCRKLGLGHLGQSQPCNEQDEGEDDTSEYDNDAGEVKEQHEEEDEHENEHEHEHEQQGDADVSGQRELKSLERSQPCNEQDEGEGEDDTSKYDDDEDDDIDEKEQHEREREREHEHEHEQQGDVSGQRELKSLEQSQPCNEQCGGEDYRSEYDDDNDDENDDVKDDRDEHEHEHEQEQQGDMSGQRELNRFEQSQPSNEQYGGEDDTSEYDDIDEKEQHEDDDDHDEREHQSEHQSEKRNEPAQLVIEGVLMKLLALSPDGTLMCCANESQLRFASADFVTLQESEILAPIQAACFSTKTFELFVDMEGCIMIFDLETKQYRFPEDTDTLIPPLPWLPPAPPPGAATKQWDALLPTTCIVSPESVELNPAASGGKSTVVAEAPLASTSPDTPSESASAQAWASGSSESGTQASDAAAPRPKVDSDKDKPEEDSGATSASRGQKIAVLAAEETFEIGVCVSSGTRIKHGEDHVVLECCLSCLRMMICWSEVDSLVRQSRAARGFACGDRAGAGMRDVERLILGMPCPNKAGCSSNVVGFKSVQSGIVVRGGTLQKGGKTGAKVAEKQREEKGESVVLEAEAGAGETSGAGKSKWDGSVTVARQRFLRGGDRKKGRAAVARSNLKRGGEGETAHLPVSGQGGEEMGEQEQEDCRDEEEHAQGKTEQRHAGSGIHEGGGCGEKDNGEPECEDEALQEQLDRMLEPLGPTPVGKSAESESEEAEAMFARAWQGRRRREQERVPGLGGGMQAGALSLEELVWALCNDASPDPDVAQITSSALSADGVEDYERDWHGNNGEGAFGGGDAIGAEAALGERQREPYSEFLDPFARAMDDETLELSDHGVEVTRIDFSQGMSTEVPASVSPSESSTTLVKPAALSSTAATTTSSCTTMTVPLKTISSLQVQSWDSMKSKLSAQAAEFVPNAEWGNAFAPRGMESDVCDSTAGPANLENPGSTEPENMIQHRILHGASALYAMATTDLGGVVMDIEVLCAQTITAAARFSPREVSNTLWALAELGVRVPTHDAESVRSTHSMPSASSGSPASSSSSMRASMQLLGALCWRAMAIMAHFSPVDVADTLWAVARIGVNEPARGLWTQRAQTFFDNLILRLIETAQLFKPADVPRALWALATIGGKQTEHARVRAVWLLCHRGVLFGKDFTPREASESMWALAKMGTGHLPLITTLCWRVRLLAPMFLPQDLTNIFFALASLGFKANPILMSLSDRMMLEHLSERSKTVASAFTPKQVEDVLWALSKMGLDDTRLVEILQGQLEPAGVSPPSIAPGSRGERLAETHVIQGQPEGAPAFARPPVAAELRVQASVAAAPADVMYGQQGTGVKTQALTGKGKLVQGAGAVVAWGDKRRVQAYSVLSKATTPPAVQASVMAGLVAQTSSDSTDAREKKKVGLTRDVKPKGFGSKHNFESEASSAVPTLAAMGSRKVTVMKATGAEAAAEAVDFRVPPSPALSPPGAATSATMAKSALPSSFLHPSFAGSPSLPPSSVPPPNVFGLVSDAEAAKAFQDFLAGTAALPKPQAADGFHRLKDLVHPAAPAAASANAASAAPSTYASAAAREPRPPSQRAAAGATAPGLGPSESESESERSVALTGKVTTIFAGCCFMQSVPGGKSDVHVPFGVMKHVPNMKKGTMLSVMAKQHHVGRNKFTCVEILEFTRPGDSQPEVLKRVDRDQPKEASGGFVVHGIARRIVKHGAEVAAVESLPGVVDVLIGLLKSRGGSLPATDLPALYALHPLAKQELKAAGGLKALCAAHAQRLCFVQLWENNPATCGPCRVELVEGKQGAKKDSDRGWGPGERGEGRSLRKTRSRKGGGSASKQSQAKAAKASSASLSSSQGITSSPGARAESVLSCLVWVLEDQGGMMRADSEHFQLLTQLHPTAMEEIARVGGVEEFCSLHDTRIRYVRPSDNAGDTGAIVLHDDH